MVGTPIDSNLLLRAAATLSATAAEEPIDVEPGSDAEFHVTYTALTSSATLQAICEVSLDGGSNYSEVAISTVIPTTEDAPGATSAGSEVKVHISCPVYIPKSTQADTYSGSLLRVKVRASWVVGGSGTITGLAAWLAPRDDGSTPARERWVTVGY